MSNKTFLVDPATLEPAPEPIADTSPTAAVRCLSKEDRLEAENIQLRIQLQSRQLQDTRQGLVVLMDARQAVQAALAEKYGIDFTREQIEPVTGRIIPAPSQMNDG